MRDLNDLVSLSVRFAAHLAAPGSGPRLAAALFAARLTRQLGALNRLLADSPQPELLFFR